MTALRTVSALALTLLLLQPIPVSANMAAPQDPDVGSSITFQRSDALAVTEEVLDITVTGSTAQITAAYTMTNITQEAVSTPVMFLAPNTGDGSVEVTLDGEALSWSVDQYALSFDSEVETEDWRYAVLTAGGERTFSEELVDAITFQLDFDPGETSEVKVSYPYRLGGYPDYDWNAKRGVIYYYLTPAALWQDFQSLTINLYLDKDMPVIKDSSVPFEKVGTRTYQYTSDTLPQEDLSIFIDENVVQETIGFFRSPYTRMLFAFLLPPVLVVVALIVVLIIVLKKVRKHKNKPHL